MGNRNEVAQNNNANGGVHEQILVQEGNMAKKDIDAPTVKKVFAVRNPIYLKKPTLTLEKDASSPNIFYIKFNYDSLNDFNCYINFDVCKNTGKPLIPKDFNSEKYITSYTPSDNFVSKSIAIKNLPRGENMEFLERNAVIDIDYFKKNKTEHADGIPYFDLSIELVPIFEPDSIEFKEKNEVVFVTLCQIDLETIERSVHSIKIELQRLKTYGMWIDVHDIFNSSLENGECLICCYALRNTIFLPCKHACACNTCAHNLKMRNNPCPICKNTINDLLILEVDEKEPNVNALGQDLSNNMSNSNNDTNQNIEDNNRGENVNMDENIIVRPQQENQSEDEEENQMNRE